MKAVAWVAGATAGAAADESLTYSAYDDAVDVDVRYTNSEIEAALRGGNSSLSTHPAARLSNKTLTRSGASRRIKGGAIQNRVLRVLDSLANDTKRIFEQFYIGKVDNNADGRALFRRKS